MKISMQVKLIALTRKQRTSTRTGKPFTSLGIKTDQHGDKWLSGFSNKDNEGWKEGDTVEIEVEQKDEYLNFTTPKRDSSPAAGNGATAELKNILLLKILPLLIEIRENQGASKSNYPQPGEDGVPNPDDMPF